MSEFLGVAIEEDVEGEVGVAELDEGFYFAQDLGCALSDVVGDFLFSFVEVDSEGGLVEDHPFGLAVLDAPSGKFNLGNLTMEGIWEEWCGYG